MGWGAAGLGASLPATAGYYAGYDHPSLAAYGYGGGYDLAARRKNATRESTATLKAWLNEHKKNPYPTKGEKIMLAIITKMTLTQVSTWFANARRRLKKENKMTWEPKNKLEDEDVKDRDDDKDDDPRLSHYQHSLESGHSGLASHHSAGAPGQDSGKSGIPIPPSKPKIWSLADTAVCKTPPPVSSILGAAAAGSGGASASHPSTSGASHPSPAGIPHSHVGAMSAAPAAPIQAPFSMPGAGMPGAYPGMGPAPWGNAFSQFADPRATAALRTNMFGAAMAAGAGANPMALMGGMMASSAAAAASLPGAPQLGAVSAAPPPAPVGLPTVSPSVSALSGNSESGNNNLQTDTPPHTPPTGGAGASQSKASALFYNGVAAASLQNGFGSSPGAGSSSASNSSSRNQ